MVHSHPSYLSVESFARQCSLHPEMVRRLVTLGLLEPRYDHAGQMWFPRSQLAAAARIQRLRAGLALNYAAIGVVVELLDRIAALEAALRCRRRSGQEPIGG